MWFNSKKKMTAQQQQMQAKLNAKAAIRQMERCASSLGQAAEKCRSFIVENERAGRRSLALQNVRAYRTITAMQSKVSCLATRIQMLMEMGNINTVMNEFIGKCGSLGGILEGLANPTKLMNSQANFADTLNQLDELIYRSESFLDQFTEDDAYTTTADPADVKALAEIMNEQGKREIIDQYNSDIDELNRALDERARHRVKH